MIRIYVDVRDPSDAEILHDVINRALAPYRLMRAGKELMQVQTVNLNPEHERDWPTLKEDVEEQL